MIALRKHYKKLRKLDAQIYALSVDTPEKSQYFAKELKLPYDLLCDVDRKVVDLYDLRERGNRGGLAYPATFIINAAGKIAYRSLDDTSHRNDTLEIIRFLEKLQTDPAYQAEGQQQKFVIPPVKQSLRYYLVDKGKK